MAKTQTEGAPPAEVAPDENLTTVLWQRAADATDPRREIVRYPRDGVWRGMTWAQVADRVTEIAAGLIAMGVQPDDRIAIMSSTRVEWTIADLAILAAGAVVVPIYETDSAAQCVWILSDAGVSHAIAGNDQLAKNLELARSEVPTLGEVFIIDEGGLDAIAGRATDASRAQVRERAAARTAADLATIIYTSGTTGNPKGCRLSHRNLLWTAKQGEVCLRTMVGPGDSTLLFLPLAHSFARLIQFLCLVSDVQMGYARSIDELREDLASFSPTFLLSVPRVFEKVFTGAQRQATGAKAKVFAFAVSTSEQWSKAQPNPGLGVRLKHTLADRLVYGKLRHAMGGRVRYCISGGAPLADHLAHFFYAAGIIVLEGYGLTETSAPATVNTPEKLKIGTVGTPLPGVEIKLDSDGEILIRGGNVFDGYHRNDTSTAEVLTADGWFRTGDIGSIDDQGFLAITGRKKELIVTAGGKNVAPAVLEERLKSHRLVSQAMVVGDNKPFIGALITLDPDELAAFATEQGLSGAPAELVKADAVEAEVAKAVEHANEAVSRAESIRKWTVLERDFTLDDAEITPTLKLRRKVITEHFGDVIEELYAG